MQYPRTAEWKAGDFVRSKQFEADVCEALKAHGPVIDHTSSTSKIDLQFGGVWIDVKEKRQPLTTRWHLLPGVPEEDLFVLDELGLRKLLHHYPHGYFLLRDVPGGRMFMASAAVMAVAVRGRTVRVQARSYKKAKLVFDMTEFVPVEGAAEIVKVIEQDLADEPWTRSGPLGNPGARPVT